MRTSIANELVSVEIESVGAELKRIYRTDLNTEYLWPGDLNSWNRSAPTLFPIVGRLIDDYYLYEGKKFSLNQHGFARDMEFSLNKQCDSSIEYILYSNESSLKVYPWEFILKNEYKLLANKLEINQRVTNQSAQLMYYSIGAHPAFRWPLHPGSRKEEYSIEFDKDVELKQTLLEKGLLSKSVEVVELTGNRINLSDQLFSNDALVFDDFHSSELTYKSETSDNGISVGWNDSPFLGIWSKQNADFLCIEPWQGIADHVDHDHEIKTKKGIRTLKPGESSVFSWWIRVF